MGEITRVEVSGTVSRPLDELFGLLSDYRRIHQVIEGLEPLSPLATDGEPGGRFSARMHLGRSLVELELSLTKVQRPSLVTWCGLGGEGRCVCFQLSELPTGETGVVITASYERPPGLGGILSAPVVNEAIRHRGAKTLELLRRPEVL
jgi:uncharacterized membrane protein